MGYLDKRDIPNYWAYARHYTLCDALFSSQMGESLTNHLYMVAAQSGGMIGGAETLEEVEKIRDDPGGFSLESRKSVPPQAAGPLERKTKPRRADAATRLALVLLSKLFAWRDALVAVKPETLIGWHRRGFRLFWRWKSKPRGRPRIPADLRTLIANMAEGNPTWGEERIAAELLLSRNQLWLRLGAESPRPPLPERSPRDSEADLGWPASRILARDGGGMKRGESKSASVDFLRNTAPGIALT